TRLIWNNTETCWLNWAAKSQDHVRRTVLDLRGKFQRHRPPRYSGGGGDLLWHKYAAPWDAGRIAAAWGPDPIGCRWTAERDSSAGSVSLAAWQCRDGSGGCHPGYLPA